MLLVYHLCIQNARVFCKFFTLNNETVHELQKHLLIRGQLSY